MKNKKNKFGVDWKFSAEDILLGAEDLVGKLPINFVETREVYGEWMDVVRAGDEELIFKADNSHEAMMGVIDLINSNLPDKTKKFRYDLKDSADDNHYFVFIDR